MSLAAGTLLGPYEILAPLGAGGMGEVYRALDTRLRREVAVKVLRTGFSTDQERLRRFQQEAEAAGRLDHPNILAIHDIGTHGGVPYIVYELLEGGTLRKSLESGALPARTAVEQAAGIAAGLAAAHDKGIIHRDLKPENIFITRDGHVKILDFGLVKILAEHPADVGASQAETALGGVTVAGRILGTAAYMSPEQARGQRVDARTDIWSFGCVLYEMLTGRQAFTGNTVSDMLAAILTQEPDWHALPADLPAGIRELLRRCLDKDLATRIGGAREIAGDLSRARDTGSAAAATGTRRLALASLIIVGLGLLGLYAFTGTRRAAAPPSRGAPTTLKQVTFSDGIEQFPAWSPDGGSIAYAGDSGIVRKIFIKKLAGGDGVAITGGEADDIQPSWSPDGHTLLFLRARVPGRRLEPIDVFGAYEGGDVWQVDIATGRETLLVEKAFNPSWSPDGMRLAVDASWAGPRRLWVLDRAGRNPQQVTTDVSEELHHLRPRWSPDGDKLVFQVVKRTNSDISIVDLQTKTQVPVTEDPVQDIDAVWSPSGKFIYFSSDRSGGRNLWRAPVTAAGSPSGPLQQVTAGAGQDVEGAMTADGRKLAFSILRQNADIWKVPVVPETGVSSGAPVELIATTREDSRGAWSPDGTSIAFNSDRGGEMNIWLLSTADNKSRQLTHGTGGDFQPTWSPDGRQIVFFSSRSNNVDIWSVDVATGAMTQLTRGASIEVNPFYSHDGRRIAYQSDQGGRLEIWVMNADGSGGTQLTRVGVGGHFLRWTKGDEEIVFRCLCGGTLTTMAVPMAGGEPRVFADVAGGGHMSFSPDFRYIMDTVGHKGLWASPVGGGKPEKVFAFDDPEVRIDYPVWSPDGRSVLLDRFRPEGGDIWIMEGVE